MSPLRLCWAGSLHRCHRFCHASLLVIVGRASLALFAFLSRPRQATAQPVSKHAHRLFAIRVRSRTQIVFVSVEAQQRATKSKWSPIARMNAQTVVAGDNPLYFLRGRANSTPSSIMLQVPRLPRITRSLATKHKSRTPFIATPSTNDVAMQIDSVSLALPAVQPDAGLT